MRAIDMRIDDKRLMLKPDASRLLLRPSAPSQEQRVGRIAARVMAMAESDVQALLAGVRKEFSDRHPDFDRVLGDRFKWIRRHLLSDARMSRDRQLLMGSYFLQEYALEAAALFNPSIVPHPDQTGVKTGATRFILSLRATGEGHVSSIEFREGVVTPDCSIEMAPSSGRVVEPCMIPTSRYEKALFERKLRELGLLDGVVRQVLDRLGDMFTMDELNEKVTLVKRQALARGEGDVSLRGAILLAQSNYEVEFAAGCPLDERVLFPMAPSQVNGIEDARFVRFTEEDGSTRYYATYTAYDGKIILPQILETEDFVSFRFITLNGPAVANKGMALFPKKIHGMYAMLSRQDNENIFLMFSDNIHFWYNADVVIRPTHAWEFTQLGNCGSPIETDAGWLVLSHGVGPVRQYSIGAFLLDRNDPSQVIGRLPEPLIVPGMVRLKGYVPNVAYTCGGMLCGRKLVLPFAVCDYATTFAVASVDDIIAAME